MALTRPLAAIGALAVALAGPATAAAAPSLVVCADPGNLPYSNGREQGFENRIARLVADDLHLTLRYFWYAEHRSFIRRTLLDGVCDVVMSLPAGLPGVATTRPY